LSCVRLETLPQFSNGLYFNLEPVAIDNAGQILVKATVDTPTGFVIDTLLLTPSDGPVTAPEPGTWIIWALVGGASCAVAKRARVMR
jgi:hypothetical protein